MTARRPSILSAAALAMSIFGCSATTAVDDTKSGEEDVPVDGKFDSFRSPQDHGALSFSTEASATLAPGKEFHAWTFSLQDSASLTIDTAATTTSTAIPDTVLYVYKKTATGTWGSAIATNDDYNGTKFSHIAKTLSAGDYRVLVKGYRATTRGVFTVNAACAGAGCNTIPDTKYCAFGTQYSDFRTSPEFTNIAPTVAYHAPAEINARHDHAQIAAIVLSAVKLTYSNTTTLASAFANVDSSEINLTTFDRMRDGSHFVAVEYGAGDNSYGGIYSLPTLSVAAKITDGDIYADNCTVYEASGDWLTANIAPATPPDALSALPFVTSFTVVGFPAGKSIALSKRGVLITKAMTLAGPVFSANIHPYSERAYEDTADDFLAMFVSNTIGTPDSAAVTALMNYFADTSKFDAYVLNANTATTQNEVAGFLYERATGRAYLLATQAH